MAGERSEKQELLEFMQEYPRYYCIILREGLKNGLSCEYVPTSGDPLPHTPLNLGSTRFEIFVTDSIFLTDNLMIINVTI